MNRRSIHERVLSATSADELASAYADWATGYDADLLGEMGYRAHTTVARTLREVLEPEGARVLDAGCGTGLVGVELARLGYADIDGLDYSPDMLAEAEKKAVYTRLEAADLTGELDLPSGHYDAVTCVGTFTLGHVGPSALDELIRVTRPGGHLCFSVRDEAWERDGYADVLRSLTDQGRWSEVSVDVVPYIEEEGSTCHVCLFRVAPAVSVTAFDHLVVRCADVERTLAWYVDRLGMAPMRVDEWRRGEVPFPSVRASEDTIIDLVAGAGDDGRLDHICLVVEPADLAAVAASSGFDVIEGPVRRFGARGDGTSLYVRDPDGLVVELRHYG